MTKIALIGCGNIAPAYLTLIPMFRDMSVCAVADKDMDLARALGAKFDVPAMSVDELLQGEAEIVVNITPPDAHFEVSKAVLEAGKHVYSEKPFVLSLEDGQALKAIADAKGLRIGSAPDTFLGGAHQSARAALDEGQIGKVIGGTCHVMSHGMEDWHPNPDFFFQPGAGPVLDLGPYYITNLVQLIGPIETVTAMAATPFATRTIGNGAREGEKIPVDTPTSLHAILKFQNGAVVTLSASWDVWAHRHKEMELYGEMASIYVPDPNYFGGEVQIADAQNTHEFKLGDHPFFAKNYDDRGVMMANYRGAGLADMAASIREGRAQRCSFDLALHVVDTMTSILRSAETSAQIQLATSCERPAALGAEEARALLKN